MKKILLIILALAASICTLRAQGTLNASGDNILGTYLGEQHGDVFKARITKSDDGTYKGQIFWMENDREADGSKRLDKKKSGQEPARRPVRPGRTVHGPEIQ